MVESLVAEVESRDFTKLGYDHPNAGDQPATTSTGYPIKPVELGFPKKTLSLCPECKKVIDAIERIDDRGRVVMEKTCPVHGFFEDIVYSDAQMLIEMEQWTFGDNRGLTNPRVPHGYKCPDHCGLCNMHTSHTSLANIDLTNRGNLICPICFAHANSAGYLYEPSFEMVLDMLRTLREMRPVPCNYIQFSGGEPTVYPRFLDAVAAARDMGFSHIQCATNAIRFADEEFALKAKEAGLHTLYFQFDGVCDDIYRRTRGEVMWERKLKASENCRKADLHIVFVPTIVKGLNDHQVGDIIRIALENVDICTGISFQPVTLTGRISLKDRLAKRYTLSDLARDTEEQTGLAKASDWMPLASVTPFSKLATALQGHGATSFSCHPHCSIGTYLFVDRDGNAHQITEFVDMKGMLREIDELSRTVERTRVKQLNQLRVLNTIRKYFRPERAPDGLTFQKFLQTLDGLRHKELERGTRATQFSYKTLMIAGMHFMDAYNCDVQRVQRCVIHYSTPNGIIYPFCTYNSGPVYRDRVEARYTAPYDEVTRMIREEGSPPELTGLVKRMMKERRKKTDASPKGSSLPMLPANGDGNGCGGNGELLQVLPNRNGQGVPIALKS